MKSDEVAGIIAALLAAICFGSYGVPMKGETATKVDVDPLVFQSYKAFAMLVISSILICINNFTAILFNNSNSNFQTWTFSTDFTPWAFVSAFLWVPGGTAGVYAIRRAGLAISVGIWSCVIVILSFGWGVLIFNEKQKSALGAFGAMVVLCTGLCGIAYFSSVEVDMKKLRGQSASVGETTPLTKKKKDTDEVAMDLEMFPHCGAQPHSHQKVRLLSGHTFNIEKYHLGLFMAVVNGILAATIMVPLHYAPPESTQGIGYSMSFGIAAILVVLLLWFLRYLLLALDIFIYHPNGELSTIQIAIESLKTGYKELPSFHVTQMWRPGLLSGVLYSMGNLFGIISIQHLGDFMGYSLNQSSMIVSGLWGLFYYHEIPGELNMIGFLISSFIVFVGILLLASQHGG